MTQVFRLRRIPTGASLLVGSPRRLGDACPYLSLYYTDGLQPGYAARQPGSVHGLYDLVYRFVRLRNLLSQSFAGGGSSDDSLAAKLLNHVFSLAAFLGLRAAEKTSCTVADAPESLIQGPLGTDKHIGSSCHVTGNNHGLTRFLKNLRQFLSARRKCTCGTLAMNEHQLLLRADPVFLKLGHV